MRTRYLPLGPISEGTLRPEDVVPALLDAADTVRMSRGDRAAVRRLRSDWERFEADCRPNHGDYSDVEIWDSIIEILGAYAPPLAYVGAHEGDGAAIGVWLLDLDPSSMGAVDVWQDDGTGKIPPGFAFRLVVNDHGNATLYTRRGKEVWSCV